MKNLETLPLMCTRNIVLFPNVKDTIMVARENTLFAINESNLNYDGYIIVVCQKDFRVDEPDIEDIYHVGTLCKITTMLKKKDGISVNILGLKRVKINKFIGDKAGLIACQYEGINDIDVDDDEDLIIKKKLIKKTNELSRKNFLGYVDAQTVIRAGTLTNTTYQASRYLIREIDNQQMLLETDDSKERALKIITLLNRIEKLESLEQEIDSKIRKKLEENQKEYLLKEKLRLLKQELNEDDEGVSDIDKIAMLFENEPYPEHIKQKAREEIKRYEQTPTTSPDSNVIRNYLDWLAKIPWYQMSKDNHDLNKAKQILDEDHFGLEKVKERILEYLAVKTMTNSLKAPIICLAGPPGVGKTSLAKSVARALNRNFVKQSLGGVRDESEIRGHRKTYVGSMPGRIIQGMKKAKTINPVFLIDEIDKMASDFRGDPSSAMLEVLDPEQNNMFSDNYIEEPYDLSNVLFIATANYIANIPPALLDRLEVIELSSYTELEKVKIARQYLIPKQLKANGLIAGQIKFSESIILNIIRYYTREAGVRNLERIIASICRKACLGILKDNKKSYTLTNKLMEQWLGAKRFEHGNSQKKDEVGVVTGLAYTSFGGDVLPIEVTYFEGKGNLNITGQLGDVMKESAEIALDWVKANAKNLDINPEWFQKHDIHIHAPEGAVPKDGPSAGVTITTAIVSAITGRKVRKDTAMTGEVTLRGNVLAIGGLKEKSLAANRSGIKKIIFPKTNLKDLEEVPSEVTKNIEFIPVTHVEQVLKEILV